MKKFESVQNGMLNMDVEIQFFALRISLWTTYWFNLKARNAHALQNDVKTWFAVKYRLLCKNSYLRCGNRTTYSKHFYRKGLNLFSFTFNWVIWRKTIYNTIKLSVRKYHHVQQRMWLWYAEFSFHCINRELDGCYVLGINYRLC